MDMTGEYRIPAPRPRVWAALNDPEILKAAIPGCEELHKLGENELEARVKAKVGPVSATFTGKVTLSELNPPESYKISGEGKGGAAGFAKGGAEVALAEDGDATLLRYSAKADVGGKLAQIGSRLIQGTAKKMADDFFGRFTALVGERHAAESAAAPAPVSPGPPPLPAETAATAAPVPAAAVPAEAALAAAAVPSAAAPEPVPLPGPTLAPPPEPIPPPAPRQVAFAPERPVAAKPTPTAPASAPATGGQPWWIWLLGLIVLVIVLFWLFG